MNALIEGLPSEPNDRLEETLREIVAGRYDLDTRIAAHRKLLEIRPAVPPSLHDIALATDSDDLGFLHLGDYPGRKTVYLHYPPTNDAWVHYGAYLLVSDEERLPHITMVKTDLRFEAGPELERVCRAWAAANPSAEDLRVMANALRRTEKRLMKELENHPHLQEKYHHLIRSVPENAREAINWKYQRLISLDVAMRREKEKGVMILPAEIIRLVRALE